MNKLTLLAPLFFLISHFAAKEFGNASYYPDAYHGHKTASGEDYDKKAYTCAHKTLPFNTMVKVTRMDNGKSVVLRVNDRGPFISGRIVDVSMVGAQALDLIREGVVEVSLEVVDSGVTISTTKKPDSFSEKSIQPIVKTAPEGIKKNTKAQSKKSTNKPSTSRSSSVKKDTKVEILTSAKLITNLNNENLYKIQLSHPTQGHYGVQIAFLSNYENVIRQVADLQSKYFKNILIATDKKVGSKEKYRVILGPFETRKEAERYQSSLLKNKKISGFVFDLSSF